MEEFFVTLDGQKRRLRFTSKDGIAIKKRMGKPLAALIEGAGSGFSLTGDQELLAVLLTIGSKHDDPAVTEELFLEEERGLFDRVIAAGGPELLEAFNTALRAADAAGIVRMIRVLEKPKPGKTEPATIPGPPEPVRAET